MRYKKCEKDGEALEHRFLTGGPWTPKGSVERVYGVHKDHKTKVLYLFKPLLYGPPMAFIDSLGVHGNFLSFRGPRSKKS